MRTVNAVGAAVLCAALGLAGCARSTSGTAVGVEGRTAATSTSAAPEVDADDVRWMDRFCGAGKVLVTAAETMGAPSTSSDPAVLRTEFLDLANRFVGVLDTALGDLRGLLPSPAPEVDPDLEGLVDGLDQARAAIASARDDVQAADPLTVEVYRSAVDRFGTGLRGLNSALTAQDGLDLPDRLVEAGARAKNCSAAASPPTTTR
ncbi:hypothetical protein [Actinokineospora bangkokensis]|uniref:Uncharacterized protein n=1 Tax=Actinokineospora bangkokensis TaxID=1193682 RepID=A0A1Q9LHN5_9PSEU|nr:hypothetical protein [Actinokineospora bangkokensis]OLR91524.1 hypothetical protein BJP25_25445 [Actinokineospora bangkokensis]